MLNTKKYRKFNFILSTSQYIKLREIKADNIINTMSGKLAQKNNNVIKIPPIVRAIKFNTLNMKYVPMYLFILNLVCAIFIF